MSFQILVDIRLARRKKESKIYVYIFYIIYILKYIYNIRNETPKNPECRKGLLSFCRLSFLSHLSLFCVFPRIRSTPFRSDYQAFAYPYGKDWPSLLGTVDYLS